jgi:hypothetical protein
MKNRRGKTMKKFLIAGNWKMNKTSAEAAAFAEELKAKNLPNAKDVCVLAPFTSIEALGKGLEGSGVGFGAQNVHFEQSGAFTGEVSVPMLKELGVGYCVVGHSERREYFNETDETVNLKLKALLAAGITPILCVGESLEVREGGGEQTFVAIALFFSILKVNPTPFSILDEIEAALDEVNVYRLGEYIKKFCSDTQFIMITHRRGTMEIADRLYGVTMPESGISKILTLDVAEIANKKGELFDGIS